MQNIYLRKPYDRNYHFLIISIVIDSDRGHCYKHLKKIQFTMKIEPVTCIWMFVCVLKFWAARKVKKWSFGFFWPNLPQLGLFHPYFVCKCCFIEISIIKMVILDQSKPISLVLKVKNIKNSKIQKLSFVRLILRHVYNPF